MGLESANYLFKSEKAITSTVKLKSDFKELDRNKWALISEKRYWIELEPLNDYSISIRFVLCNPEKEVLNAFFTFLSFLFINDGELIDLNTKNVFTHLNETTKEKLIESYIQKRKVFKELYGNYTAVLGVEDFYKNQIK
ncbi:MAG TPA: hypothetical protein VNY73_08470 [Bacteroidia bacterium]|jgi:hypothetical protein|nr:hypothetical protein [Bacteroidia bacterium]